jgi:hypothetical protein
MPDTADLAALPRRARVAFAARCARRALELVSTRWGAVIGEPVRGLFAIVDAIDDVAVGKRPGEELDGELGLAHAICDEAAAESADSVTGLSLPALSSLCDVATGIVFAVRTAIDAGNIELSACHAENAAMYTRLVLGVGRDGKDDPAAFERAKLAIAADCRRLVVAAERYAWVDSTCVPREWWACGVRPAQTHAKTATEQDDDASNARHANTRPTGPSLSPEGRRYLPPDAARCFLHLLRAASGGPYGIGRRIWFPGCSVSRVVTPRLGTRHRAPGFDTYRGMSPMKQTWKSSNHKPKGVAHD